jgi:hypothetical protein
LWLNAVGRHRAAEHNRAMTPAALAERITESNPVRQWRLRELERAGYSTSDALVLSRRDDVDLHEAVGLLTAGCPAATAVRILY